MSSQLRHAAAAPQPTDGVASHSQIAPISATPTSHMSAHCSRSALCRPCAHELAPKCSRTIARTSAMNSLPHSGTAGLHPSGVTSYWRSRFRGTEKQW